MPDLSIPALARLGAGPLALARPSAARDFLLLAEEHARRVVSGQRDPRAAGQADFAHALRSEALRKPRSEGGARQAQMIARETKPWAQRGAVAVIPVSGLLLKDYPWIGDSWATGYVQLRWQIREALADPAVGGIALWIDSPGGYVSGLFELTAFIREAREIKPVAAIVDGVAASAGYAIAAAASTVATGRFGIVGSIGVMAVHWDFSRALDEFGVVPTLLFAGKHKVDGNSLQPLPDEVKARWLAEMEEMRRVFADDVAAGRGAAMDAAAALATEAAVYSGPSGAAEAKRIGLVDEVMPPDEALDAFVDHLSGAAGEP